MQNGIIEEVKPAIRKDYRLLENALGLAYERSAVTKGRERHSYGEPFDQQLICVIERAGLSFCEGQAVKKIFEASRFRKFGELSNLEDAICERADAQCYLAAANIIDSEALQQKEGTGNPIVQEMFKPILVAAKEMPKEAVNF